METPKAFSQAMAARPLVTGRCNRAAFTVHREYILQCDTDGWPLKATWEALHNDGKIRFGYDAFRRLARKLLPLWRSSTGGGSGGSTPPKGPKGFTFNSKPKPEDLF
jgi:hypothetical protein